MPRTRARSAAMLAAVALAGGLMLGAPTAASAQSSEPPARGLLGSVLGAVDATAHTQVGPMLAGVLNPARPAVSRPAARTAASTSAKLSRTVTRGFAPTRHGSPDRTEHRDGPGRYDWRGPSRVERHAHLTMRDVERHSARDAVYRAPRRHTGAVPALATTATAPPSVPDTSAHRPAATRGVLAQQAGGGFLGSLLSGLLGAANGLVDGAAGAIDGAINALGHTVGGLLGVDRGGGPPTPTPGPSGPTNPSGPDTPATSPTPPASSPGGRTPAHTVAPAGAGSSTAPSSHAPSRSREALPAPAEAPSLITGKTTPVERTTVPAPRPSSSAVAVPQVPVSPVALLAPRVWVLVLAVGLFAIAVLFLVLGAGYRGGRRTR